MPGFDYQHFGFRAPPELAGAPKRVYPVAIVGAGPVGLALAIDLAQRGVACVLLDDNDTVSVGSRAICWSKRTLEIFDRLGVGERMVAMGVTWQVGRVFHRDRELYSFDLLPEAGHKMPAFINLQQYHVETCLIERAREFPELIDLRFKNKVTGLATAADGVALRVETPAGPYELAASYVLACDGVKSTIRAALGLEFVGQLFEERFLIADIQMAADFPSERRFWFEPVFHAGQSALMHKQPDNIYRIDLQLGPDADPELERRPERVVPRIKAVVGERPFEIDWVSVYSFQCRRLERFVHDRVIFAGDSAHVVSPFGARGGNGGIQDVDGLGWRLAAIVRGEAPRELLQRYDAERGHGADENIRNSARTTNFMTPKSPMEQVLRRAVLDLAGDLPFARRLINSGRLSVPCSLERFYAPGTAPADAPLKPGRPAFDAPLRRGDGRTWLLDELGNDFCLVSFADAPPPRVAGLRHVHVGPRGCGLADEEGFAMARYGRGLSYLFRPDQHVCAVFHAPDAGAVHAARARELAGGSGDE